MPPASDPGCVFPQPDPESEEECDVLASDCTVLGTAGPDILVGGATVDLICGLGGDDEIDGGDGADAILGGEGNDRLTGGPGADCMFGQAGEDEFLDAGDLIRRLELVADKGPTPFTMTMEFSDFGEPVDVRPPAAEDVQELSDLLERLA
jgi:hemolysin type calcium-binding protein